MSKVDAKQEEPLLKVTVGQEEPQHEPETVEVEPEPTAETSLQQLIIENVHEEDAPVSKANLSLKKLIFGDFLTAEIVRRQILLVLLVTFFLIIYIAQRYSYQKYIVEIDKKTVVLKDAKFKALSSKSELTERTRQSKVLEMLKLNQDSLLKIADRPPYYIKVPE